MNSQSYIRKIDFMDESVFPPKTHYAQNRNPKKNITREISPVSQSNQEIVDFVVNEMKDTLGKADEPQSV